MIYGRIVKGVEEKSQRGGGGAEEIVDTPAREGAGGRGDG